ncbi:MAG: hypothetical protein JO131_03135, partial [Gammaproteobacteria bacterium]|nr:hypothetical protein [Gammaproteobacteria bacterium]
MRKIILRLLNMGLLSMVLLSPTWADTSFEPLLNQVSLQLSAEQWVTTKTALVTVGVNSSVSDTGLEKVQNEVLTKLNQISNKAEWHIIDFNRSLDQSGLERVQISAQIRLASSDLVGLRDKAKAISKPGSTFTIDNIEFSPSAEELQAVNNTLRNNIYQQAKNEIANLNKLYSEDKYYLHNINFNSDFSPQPQPMMYKAANFNGMSAIGSVSGSVARVSNLVVGNKLKITANVVLAAAPNGDVMKLT